MTAPRLEIYHKKYQNPHASMPMTIPILVVSNTSDKQLQENIKTNAAKNLRWVKAECVKDSPAIMVGGGSSVAEYIEDIRNMQASGGTIFAMNAASKWLRDAGVRADYQCIVDAKEETSVLVDCGAREHLFASQVHPKTMDAVRDPIVWHLEIGDIERLFPEEKVRRGGYCLLGGGVSVGNSALCLVYALGYRDIHVFGYDSCHKDGASHAYDQPMNRFIPTVETEWAGKVYTSSVAMKAQAEKFPIIAALLKQDGCKFTVYGDGLLQAMFNTKSCDLTERDKYRLMWATDSYREFSPGERSIDKFLEVAKPEGLIADFGCGTGRASLALKKAGHDVVLIDFADNCRDNEALPLPFIEWDLSQPMPVRAPYGICCDVMEHIPAGNIDAVISNIMASAKTVFFQISTRLDSWGALIDSQLHLSVHPAEWWKETFQRLGFGVVWEEKVPGEARFLVQSYHSN